MRLEHSTHVRRMLYITVALTLVCQWLPLDVWLSRLFYSGNPSVPFPIGQTAPWLQLYHLIPTTIVIGVMLSGIALLLPHRNRHSHRMRLAALTFLATQILIVGLMVNGVFKSHWGHPRPVNLVIFGGREADYVPPLIPHFGQPGQSFPSGHVAAACAWLVLGLAWPRQRWLTFILLAFSAAVGYARLAAGGHFFSDIWWAFFMTYAGAWLCHTVILHYRIHRRISLTGRFATAIRQFAGLSLVIIAAFFLPVRNDIREALPQPDPITLQIPKHTRLSITHGDVPYPMIEGSIEGMGLPATHLHLQCEPDNQCILQVDGYLSRGHIAVAVFLSSTTPEPTISFITPPNECRKSDLSTYANAYN